MHTRGNYTWRKLCFQAEGLQAEKKKKKKSALGLSMPHYIFKIPSTNTHLQWMSFQTTVCSLEEEYKIYSGRWWFEKWISSHDLLKGVTSSLLGSESSLLGRREVSPVPPLQFLLTWGWYAEITSSLTKMKGQQQQSTRDRLRVTMPQSQTQHWQAVKSNCKLPPLGKKKKKDSSA